ncbi:MAG: DUF3783 domain-containing protein [Proteocatella sp.]
MKKILLYGIDETRIRGIIDIASSYSKEIHVVKNSELKEKVLDILDKQTNTNIDEAPVLGMELCMFAGFDRESIFGFIEDMKKTSIRRPVFATVTQNNLEWEFERVLVDVNKEHIEMQKMNK